MIIDIIQPKLKDLRTTTDRFKIRLTEPENAVNGRLWLNLSYLTIDDALREMKNIVAALESAKANPRQLEYHGTNSPPLIPNAGGDHPA